MRTEVSVMSMSWARTYDFFTLMKPRLNLLVVATTAAGYYMGSTDSIDLLTFGHAVIGTALVAGGAAALNQVAERDVDGQMQRTKLRPIPDGRIRPIEAKRFGFALSAIGLLELGFGTNVLAALVALTTLVSYISVYTPLKRSTSAATIVGAVPGGLPPVVGWAAARGTLTVEALVLFAIVFLWQLPHFFAIARMYREDFQKAGFPFLPVIDFDGHRTAQHVLVYALALLLVSVVPTMIGLSGYVYLYGVVGIGIGFFLLVLYFAANPTSIRARWLFLGSIVYLPLLWGIMIAERAF